MDKKTVASSLAYRFIDRLAAKSLGMIIGILLARLLSPEDFGQTAILTVFINLSHVLTESGWNAALIQNKDIGEDDYSTVFYASMGLAIILLVAIYFFAPFVAWYYESEALTLYLRVYAFSILFSPLSTVQMAKIQREMRFKGLMVCSIAATACAGLVGIGLAWLQAGIWSLIVYYSSYTVFNCVFMEAHLRWHPRRVFSVSRAKVLMGFGWKILASGLMVSLYNDIRKLFIGKSFSSGALGLYDRGQQMPQVIATTFDSAIQSVMFPVLSSAQSDGNRLRTILSRTIRMGSLLVVPAMIGLAAISESVVILLLTEKWLPCVSFMQIFCFAEIRTTVMYSNLAVIKAMGRSDIYMKLEMVRRIIMLIILAISILFFDSVMAIAVGYLISAWIDVIVITVPVKKLLGYGFFEQLRDIWKTIVAALLMGLVVISLSELPVPVLPRLIVQIAAGCVVYVCLCAIMKVESLKYVLQSLKDFMKK